VQTVDPYLWADWNERLLDLPRASIFHTTHWLKVLQETYGYRSWYFVCRDQGRLTTLLPFLEVRSWLTGVRGVSLPFSDYCEPIVEEGTSYRALLEQVSMPARQQGWKYLEVRGGEALFRGVSPYATYYRHTLRIHDTEAKNFSRLRSNYRSKIRKASQYDLAVHLHRTPDAVAAYYRLHCLTRKRHGTPPQPVRFFENIREHIMANDGGFVGLVSHHGRPVAGAVFFTFGRRAVYKFGASDPESHHLYATYLLFWQVIAWLCGHGFTELCFGRTDLGQAGLVQFKDGWGAQKHLLHYYRYNLKAGAFIQQARQAAAGGSGLLKKLPIPLLKLTGSVLYPHLG
jgi:CelD/BcsL family acetyltransferase involved in cellulose biosynthesis